MRTSALLGFIGFLIFGCASEPIERVIIQQEDIEGLELFVYEPGENYILRAIHFIDDLTGFASGYDGKLIRSIDGGVTWSELETNTTVPLYGIEFVSNTLGFVVGGETYCFEVGCIPTGALILRTLNGGDTWEKVALNLNEKTELKSVHFVNDSVGFAIGGSTILRTTDGGNSWEEKIIENLEGTMQKIDFFGTQKGMIICEGGEIVFTIDGGNSWELNNVLSVIGSVSISMTEENTVFVSGSSKIFKSTDFGISWLELENAPSDNFDLNFISPSIGFAVGRGGYSGGDWGFHYGSLFYTTDEGANWLGTRNIVESSSFIESSFPSENIGYLVSSQKIVKVIRE